MGNRKASAPIHLFFGLGEVVYMGAKVPHSIYSSTRHIHNWHIHTKRNYHDTTPLILSVGEEQEISIKQAAELVADAMGFDLQKIKVSK